MLHFISATPGFNRCWWGLAVKSCQHQNILHCCLIGLTLIQSSSIDFWWMFFTLGSCSKKAETLILQSNHQNAKLHIILSCSHIINSTEDLRLIHRFTHISYKNEDLYVARLIFISEWYFSKHKEAFFLSTQQIRLKRRRQVLYGGYVRSSRNGRRGGTGVFLFLPQCCLVSPSGTGSSWPDLTVNKENILDWIH